MLQKVRIAIGICYDAKWKHFYDNIKDEEIVLIAFPHGCPADPKKPDEEIAANDFFAENMRTFSAFLLYTLTA